ncbi:hypothetical protein [Mycobacteroides abscessus]|uniref:hypothetical protein n=1 Tax=Mycobacteroides abscessus TaxID=36809 RepID=UPI001F1D5AE0|nr:hypothetical protein [Mycobacteroides abscessus]
MAGRTVVDSSAPTLATRGGRALVSTFITPTGERVLRRVGYGRLFKIAGTLAVTLLVLLAALFAMATAAITATGPVSISGKLVPDASDVFGAGEDMAAAGRDGDITCHIRTTAPSTTVTVPENAATDPFSESLAVTPPSAPPDAVQAIAVKEDGSIDKADAQKLVEPVLPGTSALQADVWFMYRLAGLGDWDMFTAAYRDAGLRDDDESEDAPLRQVQILNTRGIDMEPYRLVAAALTSVGEVTGRLKDPYPGFRDLIVTELVSGCLDGDPAVTDRATLPPPVMAPSPVAEEPAVPESSAGQ